MALSEKSPVKLDILTDNLIARQLAGLYLSYSERRESLGLPFPGTIEGINKEVTRDVFLNSLTFSGLRADIMKTLSVAPLFQVSHSFSAGSQGLPPYTFGALYGSPKIFAQANLDNDGALSARFNYRLSSALIAKTSVQLAPGSGNTVSLEGAYSGADFGASIKAINPSTLEGGLTGIFVGSYLQSVTPRLSLGLEGVYQRAAMSYGPEVALSYAARYKTPEWIASAQILAQGGVQGSYWKRLSDKVEAGADVNLTFAGLSGAGMLGGMRKEGNATLGVKYEFKMSNYRAQIDSQGRLGCVLEKAVAPAVRVTFAGDMDYFKNQAKVGFAVSIDQADEEVMMQQESAASAAPPPPF